jgi:hypothetical protein
MTQFARPTPAAADYDSTIMGALELSEKKWVLAVQLPGVKRHSRHVVEARGDELAAFVERRLAREETLVTADTALRLARHFGTTAAFWINLQGQYDLERVTDAVSREIDRIKPVQAA